MHKKKKADKKKQLPQKSQPEPLEEGPSSIDFTADMKKAIGMLAMAGKSEQEIAEALNAMAMLTIDEIPVSYEYFAKMMIEKDLEHDEVAMLYRAREQISSGLAMREAVGKGSKVRKRGAFTPSILQLCGAYKAVERDQEIFDSFIEYCRENLRSLRRKRQEFTGDEELYAAEFTQTFKEWAGKNSEYLPVKFALD